MAILYTLALGVILGFALGIYAVHYIAAVHASLRRHRFAAAEHTLRAMRSAGRAANHTPPRW